MARRNAKTKKAAELDVKVSENEVPMEERGKTKTVEDVMKPIADVDQEVSETVNGDAQDKAPVEIKKRGRKVQQNVKPNGEGDVAPAKRSRRKNAESSVDMPVEELPAEILNGEDKAKTSTTSGKKFANGDISANTEPEISDEADDVHESNSKKKPAKKEGKIKESKSKKENGDVADKAEEKKGKGKGRKAQPKAETEDEPETLPDVKIESAKPKKARAKAAKVVKDIADENNVDIKEEKPKKGRGQATKEKMGEIKLDEKSEMTPDSTAEHNSEENQVEDKPAKAKKAPAKGRGKGKKTPAKDEVDDDAIEKPEVQEPVAKKQKVNHKEKGQGNVNGNEEEGVPDSKISKGKRVQKKPAETAEIDIEPEDTGEASKRRRKPVEDKAPAKDAKQKAPLKNKSSTTYEDLDFSNTSINSQGKEWNFKVACWNVDGIRAWMTKGGLDYLQYEKPDILCLQEVKCSLDKLPEECKNIPGYHAYWLCSDKDGYAGVGIYTTKLAMNVQYGLKNEELDSEGRIITAEYEHFYLICTYVPNAGRKLVTLPKRLEWNEAFRNHVKELDMKKPVVICGDMNVAHNEIDLANPKTNRKNAGFTEEERSGMTDLIGDGFVDTYRQLNPDSTGAYTFWTYMGGARAKNVGWRLDYFLVSQRLMPAVCDSVIRSQVYGSDHCPISLFLHLTTADKPKEE